MVSPLCAAEWGSMGGTHTPTFLSASHPEDWVPSRVRSRRRPDGVGRRVGNLQEPERLDPFRRGSSLHAKVRCELPLKVCRETRTLPKLGPSEVGLFSKRGRRILTTSTDDLGRPAVSQRPPGPDSHRRGPCSAAPVEWPRHFPRGPNFTSHEPCSFTKLSTGSS